MDNDYKTTLVEPEKNVAALNDGASDDEAAAEALEEIRSAERLSGFGRFATKLQNFFQATKPQQSKRERSHLKIAPIMMSAGVLMLLATGLLFVLSKPESAVPSHFRQPIGLAGSDAQNPAAKTTTEPPVTEDQLAGQYPSSGGMTTSSSSKKNALQNASTRRFSFASDETSAGSPPPTQPGMQSGTTGLATPATVFVDDPAAGTNLRSVIAAPTSQQSGLELPVGTEIVAHTTNAISSGLESPVVAVVDRSVQFRDAIVIPEGSRVIGETAGAVKNRVNVRFTSVVLPSDQQMAISGLALMNDGSAGLLGKVEGKGNPVLGGAARIGTGAAVVAAEFAGQGSLDQPFSQGDYLRNQMAAEVASQGNQLSNRWQQSMNTPIVAVDANQPITIFLMEPLMIAGKTIWNLTAPPQVSQAGISAEQNQGSDQALIEAQTAYIQALEAQLAETKADSGRNPNEHQ